MIIKEVKKRLVKASKYYEDNKDAIKEKARNKYKNLTELKR